jgi:uncharacterized membrane protein
LRRENSLSFDNISLLGYNGCMARIDEIKEILTSLRVGFSVIIGLLVVIIGVLIQKEKISDIDIYFWIGLVFVVMLSAGLILVVKSTVKHIKEIRDIE